MLCGRFVLARNSESERLGGSVDTTVDTEENLCALYFCCRLTLGMWNNRFISAMVQEGPEVKLRLKDLKKLYLIHGNTGKCQKS